MNAAASGVAVLGICGGLQQLGLGIDDPGGSEGPTNGLGLLDIETTYRAAKLTTISTTSVPAARRAMALAQRPDDRGLRDPAGHVDRAGPGTVYR